MDLYGAQSGLSNQLTWGERKPSDYEMQKVMESSPERIRCSGTQDVVAVATSVLLATV